MNISGEKRILVVEDIEAIRKDIVDDLMKYFADVQIDEAPSEEAAMQAIRNRTYHLAVLDIMLTEEKGHRGGLNVLDELKKLNEGTVAIMLSATPDINCAIHAIRSRIVVDYIHKNELRNNINLLINPIREALAAAHIPIYGKYGRLTSYLASPAEPSVWEYGAMTTISTVGFDPLNHALSDVFRTITPVLKGKGDEATPGFKIDKQNSALHGVFWSKARGHAIAVCVWSLKGGPVMPDNAVDREDIPLKGGKYIQAAIWRVPLSRDQFLDGIWSI
jgi:CheY-like chemotaxis protein